MAGMYSERFYDKISPGSVASARRVLPLVIERFNPASVVDVGCGSGAWLSVASEFGVSDLIGVDGPWAAQGGFIPGLDRFVECDLEQHDPVLGRQFDLCLSTEVAEHLSAARAQGFVDLLCSLSDLVVFSAAIPKQGGVNHVNEQWQSYWIERFACNGYGVIDAIRPVVWEDAEVDPWYRQNLLAFVKGATPEILFLDIVHPYFLERGLSKAPGALEKAVRRVGRRVKARGRGLIGVR